MIVIDYLISAPVIFFIAVSHDCSREDFLRIPELAINPLGDRIVNSFFLSKYVSFTVNSPISLNPFLLTLFCACSSEQVNFREFMQVLAHFRPVSRNSGAVAIDLNSRQAKLKCMRFILEC